jgi:hypothetical protein
MKNVVVATSLRMAVIGGQKARRGKGERTAAVSLQVSGDLPKAGAAPGHGAICMAEMTAIGVLQAV